MTKQLIPALWLTLATLCAAVSVAHAAQPDDAAEAESTPVPVHVPAQLLTTGLGFPEGTVFIDNTLYFVDYQASTVYRLDGDRPVSVAHIAGCGANGLVPYQGNLLVACYDGGTVEEISLQGVSLTTFSRGTANERFASPNDLVRDASGGVYFTASGSGTARGKVFYIPPTRTPARQVADDISNANGIALAPNGKILYLGESTTDKILAFDVASDGTLSGRREFAALDTVLQALPARRHTPDGIRTDRAGHLFVSLYNGGGFVVLDAQGKWIATATLPGDHHSNLALSPDESAVYGTVLTDALMGGGGGIYRIANPLAR